MIISLSKYPGITYDMFTGEFYRRRVKGKGRESNSVKEGVWGALNSKGRLSGSINHKSHLLHRLAFEFMGKDIPCGLEVDHINGIPTDNRFYNLRTTTHRGNMQNRESHRNGNLPGTYLDKRREKYVSQITHNRKHEFLGYFDTELEAHQKYMDFMDDHGIKYLHEIDKRKKQDKI